MQHPLFPAYPPNAHLLQRPRLSEARPHTVHAAPSGHAIYTEEPEEVSEVEAGDAQTTPRASTTALDVLVQAVERHLSRDDTAVSMSGLAVPCASTTSSARPKFARNAGEKHESAGEAACAAWAARPAFAVDIVDPAPPGSTANSSQSRQARSLSRRFSRSYKDRMQDFRDSVSKHAPRMRRASASQNTEATAPTSMAQVPAPATSGLVAPVSPTKRNAAKHSDQRHRKFRSALGLSGDRRDTPAPPAFNVASRPAPRPLALATNMSQVWPMGGGEGARKAAAAYRDPLQLQLPEEWSIQHEEDLATRRGRVGSLSSAADSGADLSRIDDQSCKDSVSEDSPDHLDADHDVQMREVEEPRRTDFVEAGKLPSEICLQIFEYLDARDLEVVRQFGGTWADLANRTSVWRHAYLRKFGRQVFTDPPPIQVGGAGVGRPNQPAQEWEKMYKAREELERNWRRGPKEAGKAIYLSGHTDSVYCVQFDEEKIITGSRDRTIRVWDINTFQCIRVIGGPNVRPALGPKCLRTVDYPSFHLATASVNGTNYGNNIYHVPSQWHDASILCLQYDDEILVTGSSDADLLVWDIKTYEPTRRLRRHTGGVLDVALDAKHIISCSKDSKIIVWDRKTFAIKGELFGHRGPVNAVQLRGKLLVSASGDGIARLWDIEQLKLVKEFSAKERGLAAVEFSEDMKYVLAGGNDHITYKFEVASGAEVLQFTGHSQLVRSLWLDSANSRVVSGSYDLDLRVYDSESGQEIWRAEEWTTSWMLAAKSDYRRIVATSQDGRILIVDFGLKKGGSEDGTPIDNVDLLRGVENKTGITFRHVQWR